MASVDTTSKKKRANKRKAPVTDNIVDNTVDHTPCVDSVPLPPCQESVPAPPAPPSPPMAPAPMAPAPATPTHTSTPAPLAMCSSVDASTTEHSAAKACLSYSIPRESAHDIYNSLVEPTKPSMDTSITKHSTAKACLSYSMEESPQDMMNSIIEFCRPTVDTDNAPPAQKKTKKPRVHQPQINVFVVCDGITMDTRMKDSPPPMSEITSDGYNHFIAYHAKMCSATFDEYMAHMAAVRKNRVAFVKHVQSRGVINVPNTIFKYTSFLKTQPDELFMPLINKMWAITNAGNTQDLSDVPKPSFVIGDDLTGNIVQALINEFARRGLSSSPCIGLVKPKTPDSVYIGPADHLHYKLAGCPLACTTQMHVRDKPSTDEMYQFTKPYGYMPLG